ncbi:hypothetical protein BHE90_014274 [Fusarium euwallaceae]|uniref:Uncharacterized protein n=5 Tax=Fusarium solani species complex TaxID=232080 RepID=A0A3M2RP29_9HYPO|nr:hypothetical protein CDV36_013322 [Fusarium kuroshium]RSL38822.1 hypothetical protein CEP53_014547 [Fusarium sp. AF-6]RSL74881.1 hypothetical protein CEP51_011382 [Fusarium floridanum]RSL93689.1 hypothetical protein CDV31_014604 [Fusarium ambrosium]RSM10983.1 hypothetical protein CEP52_003237 [Fusarium oligoseptatum]RTE71319.1 hypothetical protein BHE90_014274 [Fusarium euwallaceae]
MDSGQADPGPISALEPTSLKRPHLQASSRGRYLQLPWKGTWGQPARVSEPSSAATKSFNSLAWLLFSSCTPSSQVFNAATTIPTRLWSSLSSP